MEYVLDTSAVMRYLFDEPGADDVERIVEGDDPVTLPFMTLMEVRYTLLRRVGRSETDRYLTALRAWPVEVVESDPDWGALAAEVKARGGLPLADAWNAALALRRTATLVHQDPEFDSVSGLRSLKLAR